MTLLSAWHELELDIWVGFEERLPGSTLHMNAWPGPGKKAQEMARAMAKARARAKAQPKAMPKAKAQAEAQSNVQGQGQGCSQCDGPACRRTAAGTGNSSGA